MRACSPASMAAFIGDDVEIGIALVEQCRQRLGDLLHGLDMLVGGAAEALEIVHERHEALGLGERGLDLGQIDGDALPSLLKIVMKSAWTLDRVAQVQAASQRGHERLHLQDGGSCNGAASCYSDFLH